MYLWRIMMETWWWIQRVVIGTVIYGIPVTCWLASSTAWSATWFLKLKGILSQSHRSELEPLLLLIRLRTSFLPNFDLTDHCLLTTAAPRSVAGPMQAGPSCYCNFKLASSRLQVRGIRPVLPTNNSILTVMVTDSRSKYRDHRVTLDDLHRKLATHDFHVEFKWLLEAAVQVTERRTHLLTLT